MRIKDTPQRAPQPPHQPGSVLPAAGNRWCPVGVAIALPAEEQKAGASWLTACPACCSGPPSELTAFHRVFGL